MRRSSESTSVSNPAARATGSTPTPFARRPSINRSGRHRRAAIINGVMAVVAAGAVMAAASLSALSSRGRQPAGPPPMTLSELEVSLRRNQITPESLAALGLSGAQVETLLTQAHAALSSSVVNLRTAQSEFGEARAQEQILERKVRAGIDRAESARQLATARTALASKTEALNLQLSAVKTAAAAQILGDTQASTLAAIVGNSGWSMPVGSNSKNSRSPATRCSA